MEPSVRITDSWCTQDFLRKAKNEADATLLKEQEKFDKEHQMLQAAEDKVEAMEVSANLYGSCHAVTTTGGGGLVGVIYGCTCVCVINNTTMSPTFYNVNLNIQAMVDSLESQLASSQAQVDAMRNTLEEQTAVGMHACMARRGCIVACIECILWLL